MRGLRCARCGRVSYSASPKGARCPYCGGQVREAKEGFWQVIKEALGEHTDCEYRYEERGGGRILLIEGGIVYTPFIRLVVRMGGYILFKEGQLIIHT